MEDLGVILLLHVCQAALNAGQFVQALIPHVLKGLDRGFLIVLLVFFTVGEDTVGTERLETIDTHVGEKFVVVDLAEHVWVNGGLV